MPNRSCKINQQTGWCQTHGMRAEKWDDGSPFPVCPEAAEQMAENQVCLAEDLAAKHGVSL